LADDRTEQATPRRKEKAREKGDRARSRDLLSGSGMLAGVMILGWLAPRLVGSWGAAFAQYMACAGGEGWQPDQLATTTAVLRNIAVRALLPVGLLMTAAASATLLVGVAQGSGVEFHFETLQPKFDRLNPATNLKNIFSLRAGSRLGKSLVPAVVLGILSIAKVKHLATLAVFSNLRLTLMFQESYDLLLDAAWILFCWAAVDFLLEWRSWERRLRMSKQDLRDEAKESEGNPQIRSRIRSLQRQMRQRKMRADVSHASVVITNPTHYAVALSFDFEAMDAPRVLAKGRDLLAESIKAEARWAGVPIIENPPLARSLYRHVETGQPIPFDLYAAVAGILAFLYRKQVEEKIQRDKSKHQEPGRHRQAGDRKPGEETRRRPDRERSASPDGSSRNSPEYRGRVEGIISTSKFLPANMPSQKENS
jgi:flagellar biosynthesis protein FlhB